jgi:hypothetical protein
MRLEYVDRLGDVVLLRPPDIFQNGLGSLRNPSGRFRQLLSNILPQSRAHIATCHIIIPENTHLYHPESD